MKYNHHDIVLLPTKKRGEKQKGRKEGSRKKANVEIYKKKEKKTDKGKRLMARNKE